MKKDYRIIPIFAIFFLLALFQIHFVWLYFDDYGYASLSYLGQYTGKMGMDASLADVLSFLKCHYLTWGGRVLWFFVEIVLLKIGLSAFRLVQAIITTLLFYVLYRIVVVLRKNNDWPIALMTILCFGSIQLYVIRDAFYWFTASVLYLMPLLPLFAFFLLYDGDENEDKSNVLKTIGLAFLVFISAWSQEQVGVLITSYVALLVFHKFVILKTGTKRDIIILLVCLAGFLILILAPGSRARIDASGEFYDLSLWGKIVTNLPIIIETNFNGFTEVFTLLFFLAAIYLMLKIKKDYLNKWYVDAAIISTVLLLLVSFISDDGYFAFARNLEFLPVVATVISYFQLAVVLFMIVYYFFAAGHFKVAYLFIGAILSQATMLMAPYIPHRSILMFEMVSFIMIIYVFADIYENRKIAGLYLLLPLMLVCCFNYASITHGYYLNNGNRQYNDSILRETSERIKDGESIQYVELEPCLILYGIGEPDSVYYLMKKYYDIPDEVEIAYRE